MTDKVRGEKRALGCKKLWVLVGWKFTVLQLVMFSKSE